jgi:hypothetical protein|tara:strand:+ start:337 stop:681 length:345 start_codon:yes stop_codon:yes gene_type:complete
MKKLLLLLFAFITLTANAQNQFEGVWETKTSTYKTTIIASKWAILKVFNFSFYEDNYIEETIIKQTNTEFTTKLHNKRNGYEVIIKYKFIKNVLVMEFSGDYHGTVKLTKKYNE